MDDIAPELLAAVKKEFDETCAASEKLAGLLKKVKDGTATYTEANEYAAELGDILASVYKNNITASILPDGKMYYNIAQRIIEPTMRENYNLISDVSAQVQKALNEASGIGIKAIKPELNGDRIKGIINRISSEPFENVKWLLDEPIKNFSQSVVDDSIKVNSEFQGKAGLSPKIVRKLAGGCCEWCSMVAGTYTYPDVPKDVYRRHQRCRCTVNYDPGSGKVQNVHSKQWRTQEEQEIINIRKKIGISEQAALTLNKGTDVTKEYNNNRFPGQGKVSYDEGYDLETHVEEVETAQWLHKTFGGDKKLLAEASTDGIKMPDYNWNGKYWELKSTTTAKSANSAIRKGIKQIEKNPGGIILDYKNQIDLEETMRIVEKRVKGSKSWDIPVDIMIIVNKELVVVVRY